MHAALPCPHPGRCSRREVLPRSALQACLTARLEYDRAVLSNRTQVLPSVLPPALSKARVAPTPTLPAACALPGPCLVWPTELALLGPYTGRLGVPLGRTDKKGERKKERRRRRTELAGWLAGWRLHLCACPPPCSLQARDAAASQPVSSDDAASNAGSRGGGRRLTGDDREGKQFARDRQALPQLAAGVAGGVAVARSGTRVRRAVLPRREPTLSPPCRDFLGLAEPADTMEASALPPLPHRLLSPPLPAWCSCTMV